MNWAVFDKPPVLKLDELILKSISFEEDKAAVEEIATFSPPGVNRTGEELMQVLEESYRDKTGITWGIYLDEELIGTVGYYRAFKNDIGEIGYVIREPFRKRGITTRCVKLMTQFALTEMGLENVVAYTSDFNIGSQKVLEKSGFKLVETDHEEYIKYSFK